MRVFVAGIMTGSNRAVEVVDQGYRSDVARILERFVPGVEILDPWELHPESVSYDDETAKEALLEMVQMAGDCDLLVAYLPEASMGTAVEMWSAAERGVPVVAISPMTDNWTVKFLSRRVFPDMAQFEAFVARGGLEGLLV